MYLTYPEYQVWDGKLSRLLFERSEFTARMKIDFRTHNYYRDVDPLPEVVKRLVFELVERRYCGALDGEEYASKSEGDISVSYVNKQDKAEDLIKFYLGTEVELLIPGQAGISFAKAQRV